MAPRPSEDAAFLTRFFIKYGLPDSLAPESEVEHSAGHRVNIRRMLFGRESARRWGPASLFGPLDPGIDRRQSPRLALQCDRDRFQRAGRHHPATGGHLGGCKRREFGGMGLA